MIVVVVGWRPGLKVISLIGVLREASGMGLKDAKSAVDGLLAGDEIRLTGIDDELAPQLRARIEETGATCVFAS